LIGEAARQRDIDPVHGPARSDLTHDPLKSTWVVVPTSAAEGKGENSVAHTAHPERRHRRFKPDDQLLSFLRNL
jgi:hypothetical protein